MTQLESWLTDATRRLSEDSAAQVRTEIGEHYESAREAALGRDATPEEADRIAVAALGDAKTANRQYRRVLLTSSEARMLRQAFYSDALLKGMLLVMSIGVLCDAAVLLMVATSVPWGLILGWVVVTSPFLPIYTQSRGRIFRSMKWAYLLGSLGSALHWSSFALLGMLAWAEWTRSSIRRKLPVAQWPRQLYL